MRIVTVLVVSCVCAAASLPGQTALQVTGGVTASTILVNDGVLHTKVRPDIAPTFGLGIALPTGKGPYRVRLEAHLSHSPLNVTANGVSDNLGSLTTIDAVVMAEGPFMGSVRWQVGGGAIFYRPSENQGVFLDGAVSRWLVVGGAVFSHPIAAKMNLLINGRLDAHSFTTEVLRSRNYSGSQGVQRFMLQVGIERKL